MGDAMSLQSRMVKAGMILRAKVASGKRQNPATHLVGLKCTNLFPADSARAGALVEQGILQALTNVYETFLQGNHDIRPGDVLVVDGAQYTVAAVAPWQKPNSAEYFMHLTVEKILQ